MRWPEVRKETFKVPSVSSSRQFTSLVIARAVVRGVRVGDGDLADARGGFLRLSRELTRAAFDLQKLRGI
jgi:hypothetical protein